ncbi:pyridoxal phosphate-dependent aminotransferase [Eubacterium sp. AF36-5BH]|uniref:MalY/PatB family protein n=1 Tax=Eubacterium sp. AF36-5BH TaxID=2293108 RepID=UPI000E53E765|nr:MalY/PatB family protein [Eubacterium sp. AF36-5BH]RGF50910.1 pyridoxal phosphate-dependent aminotransferase [Eubacterium sp. AF36-5BH]
MKYDFNKIINRNNTKSLKYDFAKERNIPEDLLPLWVADMDFQTSPEIIEALNKAVSHGIYGYSEGKEEYFDAVYNWYNDNFNWQVKKEWLIKTPGVVFAIVLAINALTNEGDSVLIQNPVYYPFTEVIIDNNRKLVNNSLVRNGKKYEIDFEDFEKKIIENNVKLFILCSPHNPVGRVWKKWELEKIGDICLKHNVKIVSDEIHSDFVYPENKHIVFSSLDEKYQNITITCTAPTKTFNLAGLQISNIFIPNLEIRKKVLKQLDRVGYSQVNLMGLVACEVAYKYGRQWLNELKEYLLDNLNFLRDYLETNIPQIKLIESEGTYLIWLDCSALGFEDKELEKFIVEKAKLWLDSGYIFGKEGEGFQRINIACPRETLKKALEQLKEAVDEIKSIK